LIGHECLTEKEEEEEEWWYPHPYPEREREREAGILTYPLHIPRLTFPHSSHTTLLYAGDGGL
jgi:hypothetical protein